MKLSTILSFTALSTTATLAFPLSPFRELRARIQIEERDVYAPAPVRRSDVASSAAPTATESATAASSSNTASATATITASEATSTASDLSADSTDTWLYSTLTQNGSVTTPPASTSTLDPTTETASTTTETDYPQSTSTDSSHNNGTNNHNNNNNNNNNNDNNNSQQIIIRIKEVIKINQVIIVERPILVAVQVNIKVRQTIIVNEIKNVFITRFDNWDQDVVDQLGLVISQQFDILTRSSNSGFDNLSNDQYNQFVSKFISQFSVFQTFQLVDVQQFIITLKGFGVNQLATFFGRSDSLFSQDTFSRFNVNNNFKVFVQQLTTIVEAVSVDSFNSDDLFGLVSGSLINAGSVQI